MLLVLWHIVALMVTDSQWKIITTEEIEKKEKWKLDVSVSNHETGFLNFLTLIAFTVLVTLKNVVVRP